METNFDNEKVYEYLCDSGKETFVSTMHKISKLYSNSEKLICDFENVLLDIKPIDIESLTLAVAVSLLPFNKDNCFMYSRICLFA